MPTNGAAMPWQKLAYDQAKRELNGRFVWNIQV